jgi:uncharacterized tellurite resistance protein B-like protein
MQPPRGTTGTRSTGLPFSFPKPYKQRQMLNRIKNFFEQHLQPSDSASDDGWTPLRLAAAALMLEMTRMDETVLPEEQEAVEAGIRDHFDLDPQQARAIMKMADSERAGSTDYFQFTSLINRHYSAEQKVSLVELLWRIAYADGAAHHYEEHLVRRVADLLHVPHSDFIAAKLRAEAGS